ncbi:hypothetical protein EIL87_01800 [Saccharopolyspora rhizosphaerae]|uniref:Uncharacterized protein n=1 Tax=Saccharopolyspora rhizosphaerae TaxID=2492662 RepID=A0A3R8R872_9PSEU|nr:hypothetical protein [Saccharopolyspora rhizosphaerae]RRO20630.1 hypothetical protein EIL87_01800 [Saccharopolyspora rhizosphaerae]
MEEPALRDNCGLDPADMDDTTKAQCGVVSEFEDTESTGNSSDGEPTPYEGEQEGSTDGGYESGQTSGGEEQRFTERCQSGELTVLDGCASANTPYDDGPGSLYTNPEADPYKLPE